MIYYIPRLYARGVSPAEEDSTENEQLTVFHLSALAASGIYINPRLSDVVRVWGVTSTQSISRFRTYQYSYK